MTIRKRPSFYNTLTSKFNFDAISRFNDAPRHTHQANLLSTIVGHPVAQIENNDDKNERKTTTTTKRKKEKTNVAHIKMQNSFKSQKACIICMLNGIAGGRRGARDRSDMSNHERQEWGPVNVCDTEKVHQEIHLMSSTSFQILILTPGHVTSSGPACGNLTAYFTIAATLTIDDSLWLPTEMLKRQRHSHQRFMVKLCVWEIPRNRLATIPLSTFDFDFNEISIALSVRRLVIGCRCLPNESNR